MPETLASREALIWLLPIVFMLHDLEEIVGLRPWLRRNRTGISARLPSFGAKTLDWMLALEPERFAGIVAYEFVLISLSSILAVGWGFTNLWLGIFSVFTLHLFVHIGQALFLRRIFPALPSSLLALPYCGLVLQRFADDFAVAPLTIAAYALL